MYTDGASLALTVGSGPATKPEDRAGRGKGDATPSACGCARLQKETAATASAQTVSPRALAGKDKIIGLRHVSGMRITQLWRYPVKSLAGEALSSVAVENAGFACDRRYAIIDRGALRNGKTLTARQHSALLSFRAAVSGDGDVIVTAPGGEHHRWDDPELGERLTRTVDQPIAMAGSAGERFFDAQNILVISAASLRALGEEWQAPVEGSRFRPNIIIDGPHLPPFVETTWQQARFAAGSAVFEAVELCERCVVPTIDPSTLVRSPALLRLLVEKHDTRFGLYCRVWKTGEIHVGDAWSVVR